MRDINQETIGRWPSILPALGIPVDCLRNHHGPCPVCEGKDRFRFDDKDGRGTYYCNHCGAGDGVRLLQNFHGWDFKTTATEIRKVLPEAIEFKIPEKKDPLPRLKKISQDLEHIGDDVDRYLRGRGIPPKGWRRIRQHSRLGYYENGTVEFFPAMVGVITDVADVPISLHVTYLQDGKKAPVENPKKVMPPIKPIAGSSVRLGEGEHIGVTEGIETAMAVQFVTQLPVWAAISAHGMETLEIPNSVKAVTIFGDNDHSFAGHDAAYALAKRLANQKREIVVNVLFPSKPGTDFADVPHEAKTYRINQLQKAR